MYRIQQYSVYVSVVFEEVCATWNIHGGMYSKATQTKPRSVGRAQKGNMIQQQQRTLVTDFTFSRHMMYFVHARIEYIHGVYEVLSNDEHVYNMR